MTIKDDLDLRLLDGPSVEGDADAAPVTPPRPAPRRRLTATRLRLLIAGLVLLFAAGYLVVSATNTSAVYYLTISELRGMSANALTQSVRVGGIVVPGTIQRDGTTLRFRIVDAAPETPYADVDPNALRMDVTYQGVVPDIFQDEVHVVVEGKVNSEGVFDARTLLAKCPSRFESMPADAQPGAGHPGKQVPG